MLAADTTPLAIVLHLPLVCEEKNVVYCYVSSKAALGRAVGVSRNVIAVAILQNAESELRKSVLAMRDEIEKLML